MVERMPLSLRRRVSLRLNVAPESHGLPVFPAGTGIPRIIHQTYVSEAAIPGEIAAGVAALKAMNPGWEYRFYDDPAVEAFIRDVYGPKILDYYRRIDPRYGAARADLFRYLLIYKCGGVYLDIKSTVARPLDEILDTGERYLLCRWNNGAGAKFQGYGLHAALRSVGGGEFQQWHVIAAPGAPFLRAVIDAVLTNIDRYRPWLHGTGRRGVLQVTGPIAYTLAIQPLLGLHPHRFAGTNEEIGIVYSDLARPHQTLLQNHYLSQPAPLIPPQGFGRIAYGLFCALRWGRDRLRHAWQKGGNGEDGAVAAPSPTADPGLR